MVILLWGNNDKTHQILRLELHITRYLPHISHTPYGQTILGNSIAHPILKIIWGTFRLIWGGLISCAVMK